MRITGKRKRQAAPHTGGLIENVFGTDFSKNALVSLITLPYASEVKFFYHTIVKETETLCEIASELGYNVDLIDFNVELPASEKKYSLVLGFGRSIEDYLHQHPKKEFKLILYRNGTDSSFSDRISMKRLDQFAGRHGIIPFDSVPVYPKSFRAQIWFADTIIVLGNEYVRQTYLEHTSAKVESLDLFYFPVKMNSEPEKDYIKSQKKFLWFGSRGAVRKGLDLALDVFMKRSDIELFVCGLDRAEKLFAELYSEAFKYPNIHDLGFVKMESGEFRDLMSEVSAFIFPTIWEGGGGASLNLVGNAGLVPIVTKNLGLDFEHEEYLIEDFTPEELEKSIDRYLELSTDSLKAKTEKLKKYVSERRTYDAYRSGMKEIIQRTII
jgi:glycosyltransferase involved in cell wall biosynthesis